MHRIVELLEREQEQAALGRALDRARTEGRVALVLGEAGIGKTSLVGAVLGGREVRALYGACDPLGVPRPLGPIHDVARAAAGPLAGALEDGAREPVLDALLETLGARRPTAIVVEDVHWADDATLDLLTLLARRLPAARGCLVLTCRTDALADRPEVRRALGALPRAALDRIEPAPFSAPAVEALARHAERDAAGLHAVTGGNPFFVTEALAAPPGRVPGSVREAVMLRVSSLPKDAREVVELVSVVPGRAELWLLPEVSTGAVDACVAAGMLALQGDAVAFRHDLARRAVEEAIGPLWRRQLNATVLRALEARPGADAARLAHHAAGAGDADAIRRWAPAAARSAAAAGGHRGALAHWEAALAAADGDDLEALEGVAVEAYLCGKPERALEARRAVLALHEAAGDPLGTGASLRWLSRLLWWTGQGEEAAAAGERAIALLETLPPGSELAMALSGQAQLAMTADRGVEAIALGTRAIELARRLGDRATLAHALTNVGTVRVGRAEHEHGREQLEEAFELAVAAGEHDHAARALVNLTTATLLRRPDDARAGADLERGLAFAREHDLEGYEQYLLGVRANLRLLHGAWPAAESDARASLGLGEQFVVSVCPALVALGQLQSRRAEPEAGATLDDAWRHAVNTGELQRLAPAAAARAEHAWLTGDLERTAAIARETYGLAVARGDVWARAQLAFWLWRADALEDPPLDAPTPHARSIAGDWRGAAEQWDALGFPYEAADARSDSDDEAALLDALAAFDRLGAVAAARRLRRRLRAAGMRRVPRGPRPASRAAPAGLTPRQLDVLRLIAGGSTNAEIAERLVISPKTADHHVSAVLSKLGVHSRRDAAAAADRLGVARDGVP